MTGERESTFAFVDLAGFTALTEAHGDEEAVALLDRFEAIARAALSPKDQLVKTIGDAVMLRFDDPGAGVGGMGRLLSAAVNEPGFPIPRAGLHAGSAIERDSDYFGATVNLAARVAGHAYGGQVLATEKVALAAESDGVNVVDLGAFDLRNVTEPVELFQLDVCPTSAGVTIDPVCRMQVARNDAAGRLRFAEKDFWFCSLNCAASFAAKPDSYVGVRPGSAFDSS